MTSPFPLEAFLSIPKAELHVHLEGTADANAVLKLADRHDVRPPAPDVEGVEAWFSFDDFPMFLERYFTVLDLLRTPDDFALLADGYLRKAHDQGVVHVEFHISATGHIIEQGKDWGPIYEGAVAGCQRAGRDTGISWGLIPDVSPHLPADRCVSAMEEVLAHDTEHLVAVGMGGPADSWFTEDFTPIYENARRLGLPGVAHAAEHGGAEEVRFAIEEFGVSRIQHGIGVVGDSSLISEARDAGVAFDVCPGSNLSLKAAASPESHPLCRMLDADLIVTLGTDDPPMFHTDLTSEYRRAWEWCDLDYAGLKHLARSSIEASFAADDLKAVWLTKLDG